MVGEVEDVLIACLADTAYKRLMAIEQDLGRKRYSCWKRLPDKLVSRHFNLYQLSMVLIVAYAAYRVIIYFVDRFQQRPCGIEPRLSGVSNIRPSYRVATG